MKYLFGPVPSRRLGISLGIDLVPHKVCTLNCIYCEVGRTTNLTIKRKEYIPVNEVIKEVKAYLKDRPKLDFITFSGQGEPTLNSGLGKIIDFIKENYSEYKVAVITNGTLFWDKEVRNEVSRADVLLPSLDAVSNTAFVKINRPDKKLKINKIIEGLIQLRKEFKGNIFLEIFFVPQINNSPDELKLLKEISQKIQPDLIQLNTLDRPGTENYIHAVTEKELQNIKNFFEPLPVSVIAKATVRKHIQSFNENIAEQIIDTIKRRPCTDKELSQILNIHLNELNKYLSELIENNDIISEKRERGIFFLISN